MVVVVFVLPLKRVKGNVKDKLKKIDYMGCVLMLASAVLILIPLSWYLFPLLKLYVCCDANVLLGEEHSMLGTQQELLPP